MRCERFRCQGTDPANPAGRGLWNPPCIFLQVGRQRRSARANHAVADGEGDGLLPVGRAQLAADAVEVVLHGSMNAETEGATYWSGRSETS